MERCHTRREGEVFREKRNFVEAGKPWVASKKERKARVRRIGMERSEIELPVVWKVDKEMNLCKRRDVADCLRNVPVQ